MKHWIVVGALLAASTLSTHAYATADPYKITISGVLRELGKSSGEAGYDNRGTFPTHNVGDPFSATFYYDRSKVALMTSPDIYNNNHYWNVFESGFISINDVVLELPSTYYQFVQYLDWSDHNNVHTDLINLQFNYYPSSNTLNRVTLSFNSKDLDFFEDPSKMANSILTNGPFARDLGNYAFPFRQGGWLAGQTDNGYWLDQWMGIDLSPTRIEINAVPEPTSWALMLVGFGLTGYALRRRKANLAAA